MIIDPNDPKSMRGGVEMHQVPIIPWDAFVACGVKVYVEERQKIELAVFDPQPMETADETFQVLRFLMASHTNKPGPVAWNTVPESVQRHFRFKSEEGNGH